jgi:hypothetical protein
VLNAGLLPSGAFRVKFFHDVDRDERPAPTEQFAEAGGALLVPNDSFALRSDSPALQAGENRFIAILDYPQDGNPSNDTAYVAVPGVVERHSLIINEIMFDPLSSQNEWIELFNRSSSVIDLDRWSISDRPTASGSNVSVVAGSLRLQPQQFAVIAAETTIFSLFPGLLLQSQVPVIILGKPSGLGLNNDGDHVVLRDPFGTTIDSVAFLASWHHPDVSEPRGRSLERVNPDLSSNDRRNWSTSPSPVGGTPGEPNGIFTRLIPNSASISMSPNPFSPDGDGVEDFCIVRYNLPLATSIIRLTVFDARGRLIRTLANTELSGAHGELVWDGLDDVRQRVRIGPYILYLEAIDGEAGILATCKAVVVVAARL